MTQKDTATIREVYDIVSQIRQEQLAMKKELKDDFKASMDAHCEWSKEIVAHYELIAQEYEKRINKTEQFIDNLTGKITIIAGIVGIFATLVFDVVKEIFSKGK